MNYTNEGQVAVEGGRIWFGVVGSGRGTPLLLLHGGPGFPSDYLEPLAELADERPVIFYDQLGAGRSDQPRDPALYTVARYVRELASLRSALKLDSVHIYGQSWGTSLAVEYALTGDAGARDGQPLGIRSLVLSSPCISVQRWREDADQMIAELPQDAQNAIAKARASGSYSGDEYQSALRLYNKLHLSRLDSMPEPVARSVAALNPWVYEKVWGPTDFEAMGAMRDFERAQDLRHLTMPVLYNCGRHDGATPEATEWYRSITPNAEIAVFEESSHVPHLEEPEAHLSAVREFLRRADG